MRRKHLAVAALVLSAGLTLSACGSADNSMDGMSGTNAAGSTPSASSSVRDSNQADATFAADMIPHHLQAVEMAKLAPTRAKSQAVRDLAKQIMKAQGPEIQTMSGWLTSWGKPQPQDMSGMDMSSTMPGMMSNQEMDTLMGTTGARFDRMFLTMMIKHHQGAIQMAKTEQADGQSLDAIALAKQIETAQTEEITTMKGLLG